MMSNKIKTFLLASSVCWCATVFLSSCNEDWVDEQYEHYISFKAPLDTEGNSVGVTTVYVPLTRSNDDGTPRYGAEGLSSYELPVIVSGSTHNEKDLDIHIAHDPDTLQTLNYARFNTRKELYYTDMAPLASFDEVLHISSGQDVAMLHINLDFRNANFVNRYVLPLTIVEKDEYGYQRHPRKNYAKALLRILPYTLFSGAYESGNLHFYLVQSDGRDEGQAGAMQNAVQLYAIDENTAFFYAGNNDESRLDRENYKVYAHFAYHTGSTRTGTVTFTADNPNLNFTAEQAQFRILEEDDATESYIRRRTVIIQDIDYHFTDYTMAQGCSFPYHVKGTLTMERKLNTQMPEEDQIEW